MRNKRTVKSNQARLIKSAMLKLEANPHTRYEAVLTVEEHREAVLMMRAAVAYVQGSLAEQRYKGKRLLPPARFEWRGCRYPLHYSNMGRVFIATQSGKDVLGSDFFAI